MPRPLSVSSTWFLFAALGLVLAQGCFLDDASSELLGADQDAAFEEGQRLLVNGEIAEARKTFSEIPIGLEQGPSARVAEAITCVLLLPEHDSATELFALFGADSGQLPIDVEGGLYGANGVLQRLSSGASDTVVQQAFAELLPWTESPFDTDAATLFANVDPSVTWNDLHAPLLALSAELGQIERLLNRALDAGFVAYTLPQGALSSAREHTLRRSEVLAMLSMIASVRGFVELIAAYDWPIELRPFLIDSESTDLFALTNLAELLNNGLFVALAESSRLSSARTHWVDAVDRLKEAVQQGAFDQFDREGIFDWSVLSDLQRDELSVSLDELRAFIADDVPTIFTFASPDGADFLSGTLGPLFAGNVTRDAAVPLVLVASEGPEASITVDTEELFNLLVKPFFEPFWSDPDAAPDFFGKSSLDSPLGPIDAFLSTIESDYNF